MTEHSDMRQAQQTQTCDTVHLNDYARLHTYACYGIIFEPYSVLVHSRRCLQSLDTFDLVISRVSGLILVCPCIRVHPSWADKTSILPLFQ